MMSKLQQWLWETRSSFGFFAVTQDVGLIEAPTMAGKNRR